MLGRRQEQERGGARGRGGFALVELVVAGTVLVVGALAFVQLFTASSEVARSNRETALAADAARRVLEQLEAFADPSAVFALHNATEDDDPASPAPAPGVTAAGFAVAGLEPAAGDVDGLVGALVFPTDPATGALREDLALPEFGLPRDLNGDGALDGADRSGDYVLLPVRVELRWSSGGTTRTHSVTTLLSPR